MSAWSLPTGEGRPAHAAYNLDVSQVCGPPRSVTLYSGYVAERRTVLYMFIFSDNVALEKGAPADVELRPKPLSPLFW
jgi:hypothetical protein